MLQTLHSMISKRSALSAVILDTFLNHLELLFTPRFRYEVISVLLYELLGI